MIKSVLLMEKYPRGRRGSPAKGVGLLKAARVQIPASPPSKGNPNECVWFAFFIPRLGKGYLRFSKKINANKPYCLSKKQKL